MTSRNKIPLLITPTTLITFRVNQKMMSHLITTTLTTTRQILFTLFTDLLSLIFYLGIIHLVHQRVMIEILDSAFFFLTRTLKN